MQSPNAQKGTKLQGLNSGAPTPQAYSPHFALAPWPQFYAIKMTADGGYLYLREEKKTSNFK